MSIDAVTIRQIKQALACLGIGMMLGGIFLAVPDTYNSWKFVRHNARDIFGQRYVEEKIYRFGEDAPRIKPYKVIQGQAQRKIQGVILLFFGGNIAWFFGQCLADEFEVIERRRWKVRQIEFVEEDTTLMTGAQVQQTMIEMDLLSRLSEFQQGFRPDEIKYLPEDEGEDTEAQGEGGKYPESANGFFMWLIDKNIQQAKVRELSQKSFNNGHLSADRIRGFVQELIGQKLAEWLDDAKSEFRLLNVSREQ